jgi:hypothetical protein
VLALVVVRHKGCCPVTLKGWLLLRLRLLWRLMLLLGLLWLLRGMLLFGLLLLGLWLLSWSVAGSGSSCGGICVCWPCRGLRGCGGLGLRGTLLGVVWGRSLRTPRQLTVRALDVVSMCRRCCQHRVEGSQCMPKANAVTFHSNTNGNCFPQSTRGRGGWGGGGGGAAALPTADLLHSCGYNRSLKSRMQTATKLGSA